MDFPSLAIDIEQLRVELGAPSLCDHAKSELRNKPDRNRRPRLHTQCFNCGASIGPRVSVKSLTAEEIGNLPLFDESIQRKRWSEFHERFKIAEERKKEALKQKWKACYDEYLRSPEWRKRRALVLQRANGHCEGCMSRPPNEVHHTTYDNVGEEFLFQLVALCEECHRRLHSCSMPALLERLWEWEFHRRLQIERWA